MLTEHMANPNGFSNLQVDPCRGRMSLPPLSPVRSTAPLSPVPSSAPTHSDKQVNIPKSSSAPTHSDKQVNIPKSSSAPTQSDKQVNMPKSSSTDVLSEDPPPWLEELLNEPESPVRYHHRRSASDSFTYLALGSITDGIWPRNIVGSPAGNFQMPPNFNSVVQPQASFNNRKTSSECKPAQNSPPLPNVLINAKEDADCQALGMTSSPEPARVKSAGSETESKDAAASITSEKSSGGIDSSHLKPPPASTNTDAKRKQHNARRSRVRKLQYIAELERNAQALQAAGAEVSAQLEFLDQQNLILGMENRALKQRLESLSQEHYIKSMEQEILDKERGRLQYLYHLQRNVPPQQQRQRQKQNPALHRRGRSFNDLDSQLSRNSLHCPPKAAAAAAAATAAAAAASITPSNATLQ